MLPSEFVVVSSVDCSGHYNFIFMQFSVLVVFETAPSELASARD